MSETKRDPGRPKGINFPIKKNIKITEAQNKKWNKDTPKLIRNLLEGTHTPINDNELTTIIKTQNNLFAKILKNDKVMDFIEGNDTTGIMNYLESHRADWTKAKELVE